MKSIKDSLSFQLFLLVLSAALGWGLNEFSKEKSEPIFVVDNIRSELINRETVEGQPIKILKSNGEVISQDLISVTFYLFNQGNKAIVRQNVANPLKVVLVDSTAEIIGFKVVKSSRPDINITLSADSVSNLPSVDIDFKFLEKNDGFTGQIIYLGKVDSELKILGNIIGTKNLNEYPFSYFENTRIWIVNNSYLLYLVLPVIMLLTAISMFRTLYNQYKNRDLIMAESEIELNNKLRELTLNLNNTKISFEDFLKESENINRVFHRRNRANSTNKNSLWGFSAVTLVMFLFVSFIGYRGIEKDKNEIKNDQEKQIIMNSIPESIKP